MGGFNELAFWRAPDFRGRMQWYRAVADNRLPAKYLIAARVPAGCTLDAPEEQLWQAFDAAGRDFLQLKDEIRGGRALSPARL
jgi:uncharacterized Fe-S radical SAM superfamily protein PflX